MFNFVSLRYIMSSTYNITGSALSLLLIVMFILIMCIFSKTVNFNERFDKINNLNKTRGKLGKFLVDCDDCDNKKYQYVDSYCKNDMNDNLNNFKNSTMSFYNDKYIDKNVIYCYNCLLDNETNLLMRNYKNFPYINGPPGTNFFTH